ncbi:MAG: thioredoxin [Actinomycetota bacterium]
MEVRSVTKEDFVKEVLNSDLPVVVDFHADWCGPCKQIAPAIQALAEKWDGKVRFFKVDIDAETEIARAYNISSIPAVLRFEQGEVTNWSLGAKPAYLLEKEMRLTSRGVEAQDGEVRGFLSRVLGRP